MKISFSWTNEQELMWIECYHAEPIVWDAKYKDHKNKMKMHGELMRIKEIIIFYMHVNVVSQST